MRNLGNAAIVSPGGGTLQDLPSPSPIKL